ncbi:MAG: translation elongation factor Ts [Oscillospiraceae bacterium]|nr:translation elongation factor Ts [Oscillospiraceae bacterium]
MAFTAKDVQALREKTGVGMMDCKKALVEADGDMDKAVDILREKGLASQAKKSGRVAAEGVVAAYSDDKAGALVEINCETDFVAKGEPFVALANKIAKTACTAAPADVDALLKTDVVDGNGTVEEAVQEVFLALRENMKVRRFERVEGHVATYIHAGGTVGVMVSFDVDDATAEKPEFEAMGKNVAMQIAAMNPSYLDEASVPADVLDKEKAILVAQMKEDPKMASKPEAVLHKIVEGKIGKYYKENCLVDQEFVRSDIFEGSVGKYVENVAKTLGSAIKLTGFVRYERGEGIEKKQEDFAAEIESMVK